MSVCLAAAALTGCDSDDTTGETPTGDIVIARASPSGDGQVATVGETLPIPIRALVTNLGVPIENVDVEWSVASGGGQLSAAVSRTDADGTAFVMWTLGPAAGVQTVRASIPDVGAPPATFTAIANSAAPATLALAGSSIITGVAGNTAANALRVVVHDTFGNGVEGVLITWTVTSGNTGLTASSTITNGSGEASVTVIFGPAPSTATVSASTDGVTGSPVSFTIISTVSLTGATP